MDNLGYKNWKSGYNDDSYGSSPSPDRYGDYYSGKSTGKGATATDSFDYDISSDFADSPPVDMYSKRGRGTATESNTNRFSVNRNRASVSDRTKEILERNKAVGKSVGDIGDGGRLQSYQDTFKDLMEGLEDRIPTKKAAQQEMSNTKSHVSQSLSQSKFDMSLDSPRGDDSLEISAADLEVGALAARRAREKASDRRRRMSLDKAPHTMDQNSFQSMKESAMRTRKGSTSPDITSMKKIADGGPASMQFSSALSSIQRSMLGEDDKVGYGSMGRSDDDIYKMLNVTAGTNDSLKFGDSMRQSAAGSRTSNLRASGGGGNRDDSLQLAAKKAAVLTSSHNERTRDRDQGPNRGGDDSDGGDVSDVTQGSSRDEDDDDDPRSRKKPPQAAAAAAAAIGKAKSESGALATLNANGRGGKAGGSSYTMRELEDSDEDGNSGDSDKAYSPEAKAVAAEARFHDNDDDEYSLDDFEPDAFTSPEKAHKAPPAASKASDGDYKAGRSVTSSAAATPSTASSTPQAPQASQVSNNAPLPPKKLGSPSPAHKTLTPTNSTSSMQTMSKSAGMNSVEEIMQRWYTADSEFMQRSLQRIGTGETGFSLDDNEEDAKVTKSPTSGIAAASHDIMVSTPVETTVIPASTSGSSLAVVPPHSMNPSPFPGEASPSPLTTAAPTPATLNSPTPVIGTAAGVAEDGSNRPASVNSQYTADSMRARGDTSVAGDSLAASSKGQSSTLAGASFASQRASPAVEGSAVASSIQVGTKVETGQQGFRSGVASVADDRNIFELSDSYNDAPHQHLMGAVNAQTSSVQVMQTLAVPAAAPANSVRSEPAAAPKPFEPPRLFSNSNMENSNSYMALDQLSQFNNDVPAAVTAPVVVEAPVPQSSYQRNARPSSAGPGSVSPSLSAASRYRDSDDAQEQPSEDTTSSSTRSRSARDPLDYVLGEAALPAPTKTAERGSKQSWIVPPKDLNRRSCSAPPGAFSGRPSTASTRGAEREHDSYQPPRRMSAATAAKVQQLKSLSPEERSRHRTVRPRHGVSASTAAPNAITSIRWHQREKQLQALVGERQNADAVQRLSQENWRLSRKFERLQHELADLRDSQQFLNESGIGALPPPPKPFLYKKSPGIGAVTSKHELGDKDGVRAEKPPKQPRASVFDVSGFSTRDSDAVAITAPAAKPKKAAAKKGESSSAASHRNIHEPSSNNECDQQSPGSSDRPSGIPRLEKGGKASGGGSERLTGTRAAEGWEVHMEEALQRLKEENRKLLEREKDVLVREQALAIREATVEMKEKMVGELAAKKSKEDHQRDFFVNEELTILREREQDLLLEVDKLKAALFMQGQDAAAIEDGKLRLSLGLDTELNIDGSYKPLFDSYAAHMHKAGIYPQSVLKPALKSHYLDKVKGKGKNQGKGVAGDGDAEVVTVNKEEYEKLVSDHAAQERLLDSFQKENDRLAKFAREKDTEQQLRSAVYFDQREELNKELNRLKNATRASGTSHPHITAPAVPTNFDDVPVPTSRKTAETLRMELQMDATIRALKEQLADAESGRSERERDLQVTIEKLRRDNRELAAKAANVTLQQIVPQDSDYLQLQTENRVFADKVAAQQQRLEWYAQNQKLLDAAEEEVQQCRQTIAVLKRELVQRGLEPKTVDRLIHSASAAETEDQIGGGGGGGTSMMDRSVVSTPNGKGRVHSSGRSFADIKKIKELEGVIRDLQESLTKRHPDSVSNMIRAAKDSDAVQLERRKQEQHIASLQQELEEIKQQHEKRLRSLRQEHERMQIQYEKLLAELRQVQASEGAASPGQGLGGYGKGSTSAANSVKTLTQALNKIRELEVEGERTRAFYIKKVEETQRKFEVQIRALKRGEQLDSNPAERGHSTSLHEAAGTSSALQQQQQQEALNQQVQQATRMYSERLALLEKELMTTAQELGRVKAANLARDREQQHQQQGVYPGHPYSQYPYGAPAGAPYLAPPAPHMPQAYSAPPPAPPSHQQQQARTNADTPPTSPSHQQQQQQHQPDSNKITSSERQELQARHEQRVEELTAAHNAHLSQLTMHWNVEREGLQKRLREEEARCAELRRELMNAVRGAAQSVGGVSGTTGADSTVTVVESKAPEMKQFLQMESQIDALEVRLQRREKELLSAVDEAKAAAALERSRLEALHAQECREKDEQLVRFQEELVQLVTALRHWKQNAETPGLDVKTAFPLFV